MLEETLERLVRGLPLRELSGLPSDEEASGFRDAIDGETVLLDDAERERST